MKVKYELDQRRTSGIQLNSPESKIVFSTKLGDKKIVRLLEETDRLNKAVKGGYLIKHIGEGKVLTKDGELVYAEYKKQLKKLNKKAPVMRKAKKAKKEEAKKEEAKKEEPKKEEAKKEEPKKDKPDRHSKKKGSHK